MKPRWGFAARRIGQWLDTRSVWGHALAKQLFKDYTEGKSPDLTSCRALAAIALGMGLHGPDVADLLEVR